MSESVLVVDDDPDVARFIEVNLRSAGYEVAVASNGEEALERALEVRPDLRIGFDGDKMWRASPEPAAPAASIAPGRSDTQHHIK